MRYGWNLWQIATIVLFAYIVVSTFFTWENAQMFRARKAYACRQDGGLPLESLDNEYVCIGTHE